LATAWGWRLERPDFTPLPLTSVGIAELILTEMIRGERYDRVGLRPCMNRALYSRTLAGFGFCWVANAAGAAHRGQEKTRGPGGGNRINLSGHCDSFGFAVGKARQSDGNDEQSETFSLADAGSAHLSIITCDSRRLKHYLVKVERTRMCGAACHACLWFSQRARVDCTSASTSLF
jgi:hypothetical protein